VVRFSAIQPIPNCPLRSSELPPLPSIQVVCCVGAPSSAPLPLAVNLVQRVLATSSSSRSANPQQVGQTCWTKLYTKLKTSPSGHSTQSFCVLHPTALSRPSSPPTKTAEPSEKLLLGMVQKVVAPSLPREESVCPCSAIPAPPPVRAQGRLSNRVRIAIGDRSRCWHCEFMAAADLQPRANRATAVAFGSDFESGLIAEARGRIALGPNNCAARRQANDRNP